MATITTPHPASPRPWVLAGIAVVVLTVGVLAATSLSTARPEPAAGPSPGASQYWATVSSPQSVLDARAAAQQDALWSIDPTGTVAGKVSVAPATTGVIDYSVPVSAAEAARIAQERAQQDALRSIDPTGAAARSGLATGVSPEAHAAEVAGLVALANVPGLSPAQQAAADRYQAQADAAGFSPAQQAEVDRLTGLAEHHGG